MSDRHRQGIQTPRPIAVDETERERLRVLKIVAQRLPGLAARREIQMVGKGGTVLNLADGLTRPSTDYDADTDKPVGKPTLTRMMTQLLRTTSGLRNPAASWSGRPSDPVRFEWKNPTTGITADSFLNTSVRSAGTVRPQAWRLTGPEIDDTTIRVVDQMQIYTTTELMRGKASAFMARAQGRDTYDIAWALSTRLEDVEPRIRTTLDQYMNSGSTNEQWGHWRKDYETDPIMIRADMDQVMETILDCLEKDPVVRCAPRTRAGTGLLGKRPGEHRCAGSPRARGRCPSRTPFRGSPNGPRRTGPVPRRRSSRSVAPPRAQHRRRPEGGVNRTYPDHHQRGHRSRARTRTLTPALPTRDPMRCTHPNGANADDTRTLQALVLEDHPHTAAAGPRRRGLFVDVETTGFDPERDAVIELAMLPFLYTLEGLVTEVLRNEARSWRQDPGAPLPTEITQLTDLTDEDLAGQQIDTAAADDLVARSDLVIAHNAAFDRPSSNSSFQAPRKPPRCSRLQSSSVLLANIGDFCSDYLLLTDPEYSRSLRTCSHCVRRTCTYRCACGLALDRDINAARNLANLVAGSSPETVNGRGERVSRALPAVLCEASTRAEIAPHLVRSRQT